MMVFMTAAYLRCSDDATISTLRTYESLITTLANTSAVHYLREEMPPAGCAMLTVSAHCEAHVLLKVIPSSEQTQALSTAQHFRVIIIIIIDYLWCPVL